MTTENNSFSKEYTNDLDRIIRQIITIQRSNYLENGESARGIPSEVKKIIEANINRLEQ